MADYSLDKPGVQNSTTIENSLFLDGTSIMNSSENYSKKLMKFKPNYTFIIIFSIFLDLCEVLIGYIVACTN